MSAVRKHVPRPQPDLKTSRELVLAMFKRHQNEGYRQDLSWLLSAWMGFAVSVSCRGGMFLAECNRASNATDLAVLLGGAVSGSRVIGTIEELR